MKYLLRTIVSLFCIVLFGYSNVFAVTYDYNVKNYGAVGDGIHLDTEAINAAIDAAAEEGGGIVFFPGW